MTDFNTPAPIGHNSQREPREAARIAMDEALAYLRKRLENLLESEANAKADTEEAAEKVTDLAAMFASLEGSINRVHSQTKAPYFEAGQVIDGMAAAMRDPVLAAMKRLNVILTTWQTSERNRIETARAAERTEMADDPEPSYVTLDSVDKLIVTTRGRAGARAHLVDRAIVDTVDVTKLEREFLERPRIIEAIRADAQQLIRVGVAVTGVTTKIEAKSQVRKGG